MCEYYIYHVYVYRKYLLILLYCHIKQVSGIHGFGFGDGFSPEKVFGFGF